MRNNYDITADGINIDSMLDVYVNTQKESGIDPGLEECEFEVSNKGDIIRKKPIVDDEPTKEQEKKEDGEKCSGNCKSCHCDGEDKSDKFEKPWYLKNKLGLFEDSMSPEIEDDEDDDETYVCEYCSDVGYKKEYKSYLCDTCNVCETCTEYANEECSGCGYSVYRTGRTYSQEMADRGENIPLDKDEQELIDYSNHPETFEEETEIRDIDNEFSIMDYDHKY